MGNEASMLTEAFKSLVAAGPVAMVLGLVAWGLWKKILESLAALMSVLTELRDAVQANTSMADQVAVLQARLDQEQKERREEQERLLREQKDIMREVMVTSSATGEAINANTAALNRLMQQWNEAEDA
jgi:flagellar hook-basal body complex protein FliE